MNPSSSSSFSSPPLFVTSSRPTTTQSSALRETPSIIPLDYNYQVMAPSSLRPQTGRYIPSRPAARQNSSPEVDVDIDEDPTFNSLFGDPVPPPPPEDFFASSFSTPAFIRATSVELSSEEDQLLGQTVTLAQSRIPQRLFSQVPYTSLIERRYSNVSSSSQRNFDVLPSAIPRLKPPDIQVLPNSSGESSTGQQGSPNYTLLAPTDILRKSSVYEKTEPADIMELKETYTISDAQSLREFTEATTRISCPESKEDPGISDRPLSSHQQHSLSEMPRQLSNESYSSGEWFRSVNMEYPEFNKMPKLRPSSKNVMSIKRDEMPLISPVAAMINDSNGSSSGEERLMGSTQILEKPTVSLDSLEPPLRPPSPSPSCLRSLEETIVLTPREYIKQRRKSVFASQPSENVEQVDIPEEFLKQRRKSVYAAQQTESLDIEDEMIGASPEDSSPPPPIPPMPHMNEEQLVEPQTPLLRQRSPVILKDSITTGGDYRVDTSARLHKKTAFTIINDKSSQSRTQTPQSPRFQRAREHTSPSLTPTRPVAKPRHHLQRKSLSSTQLKLPHLMPPVHELAIEDSPRPSVQFDMTGRYSPSKLPSQKGILHQRELLHSSQDTMPAPPPLATTGMGRRPSILTELTDEMPMKSADALPLITDPYRTAIPRLNRSEFDLRPETAVFPPGALPRPLKPNPNPTRKQKGLLKVLNHEESLSRIPLKSNWSSMDDLFVERRSKPMLSPMHDKKSRRRSSSTSPSRRSSTQTTSDRRSSNLSSVTTSDFSFRRPSVAALTPTQMRRRKSVYQVPSPSTRRKSSSSSSIAVTTKGGRSARTKVAKPTTLSPIIGTPNKDSSSAQSPTHSMKPFAGFNAPSDSVSDTNSRRDSLSKIPVRSQANSRSNSRAESRTHSRTGSPTKELASLTGRTSQMDLSRSGSRASMRGASQPGSRAASRAESRPDSRADSRAASRGESRGEFRAASRAGSRAASRAESRTASRADSRAPSRSTSRASTRPISLPGSRPTSRMEQAKEIANSRSNSRLSMRSSRRGDSVSPQTGRKTPVMIQMGRRKSVSVSPQRATSRQGVSRRSSISPQGAKSKRRSRSRSKTRSSPDISSRSRIPVSRNGTKSPPRRKALTSTELRRTGSLKTKTKTPSKQPASAKKLPSSIKKPESSSRKATASNIKPPVMAKREVSNVRKPAVPSAPRRESSTVSKKPTVSGKPGKREISSVNLKAKKTQEGKTPTAPRKNVKDKKPEDKKPLGKTQEIIAKKDANAAAKAAKNEGEVFQVPISKSGEIMPAATAAAAAAAADVATLSAFKRQPSTMSLMRVGSKISLLNKKRSDSNLSKSTLDSMANELDSGQPRASSPSKPSSTDLADGGSLPAVILEKSQKTLESIQKTVTEATDEIHKTINENLTDLKSYEQDMGLTSDSGTSPSPSVTTVVEKKPAGKKGDSVSRLGTADTAGNGKSPGGGVGQKSPLPPSQPIEASVSVLNADGTQVTTSALSNGSSQMLEAKAGDVIGTAKTTATAASMAAAERVSERAISVMPEVDCESANFQSYETIVEDAGTKVTSSGVEAGLKPTSGSTEDYGETEAKRRSPDGQGGSQGSGKGSGSQEYLEKKSLDHEEETPKGCCRCCAKFCMPCRRSNCSRCCKRKRAHDRNDEATQPVLSATSSATTTNLELIDEKDHKKKTSCWQKLNCCKSCCRKNKPVQSSTATIPEQQPPPYMSPPKQSKCGLCLSKIFCCRSVNKIDPKTGDETEVKKCCFCIPCRRKRSGADRTAAGSMAGSTAAWQDPEAGIAPTDAAVVGGQPVAEKQGCCKRFCNFLLCCRKKKVQVADSRRQSIKPPPAEDTRRKLHVDLVEYTSKMKGAIPVLPLCLAWFCAICNVVVPGLGTLLSGFFCICVGIPRFSHYDSAKARLGSFIINIIVALAQLFCVLFCFVGWGWSIWWGTIMLKCAKKLSKIRKVERLEMEEEKRQAAAAAASAAVATKTEAEATKA